VALPVLPVFGGNEPLAEALHRFGVRYLIVGGFGVHFHDTTRDVLGHDLDLLFDPTVENAEKLIVALGTLHVALPPDAATRLAAGTGKAGFPLKVMGFYADVLFEPGIDFAAQWNAGHDAHVGNVVVRVASARTLLERLTGSSEPKHADDAARLKRILEIG
jgi:hypothetical protein